MSLSNEQLLKWNQQGIIPGPEESEDAFIKRAHYCEQLREHFPQIIPGEMESIERYESALSLSHFYFDIKPAWIPLFFSNYQLRFWQGGCAWIFQESDDSPTASFFQLRQAFRHSSKYLGIYERDEMISHELSHVGRMVFQEPKYEEVLAYQTARSSFRRWFGPIIQSSYESMIFVLVVFFTFAFDVFALFSGNAAVFVMASWLKLLPLALLLIALYRLYRKQKTFSQTKRNLINMIKNEARVNAILYRLRDREIDAFANMSADEIRSFAISQEELRWHLIQKAYLE